MLQEKRNQGIDGVNFKTKLDLGNTLFIPCEEKLNKRGEKIFTINISNGILNIYCNLPKVIRNNNIIPFGINDYEKINYVKNYIVNNTRSYLLRHLKIINVEDVLQKLNVSSLECNLTSQCVGSCTPSDVIKIINISRNHYKKDTVLYQKTKKNSKYEKDNTTLDHERVNKYKLKTYDKTLEMNRKQYFDIEPNMLRIEFVYSKRLLVKIFNNNLAIDNVFSEIGFNKILNEYTDIFENDIIKDIKKCLTEISNDICIYLLNFQKGRNIENAIYKFKERILDAEMLRHALRKYYKKLHKGDDYSRQSIKRIREKYNFPEDVIETIKIFHRLCQNE